MLSKFIYRFVTVFLLVALAQVGYSQNYVGVDASQVILEQAITQLHTEMTTVPVYTGKMQQDPRNVSSDRLSLQLMRTIKAEIMTEKSVQTVMDAWYQKANAEGAERKTKLLLALDGVKNLLS
jgi:hypothetical protein